MASVGCSAERGRQIARRGGRASVVGYVRPPTRLILVLLLR